MNPNPVPEAASAGDIGAAATQPTANGAPLSDAATKPSASLNGEAAPAAAAGASAPEPSKLAEPPSLEPPTGAEAPKPVSVEDVKDAEAPLATTGAGEVKPVPAVSSASDATGAASAEKPSDVAAPGKEADAAITADDKVIDKSDGVNGVATNKDVQMTGALKDPSDAAADTAPSVEDAPSAPAGAGEREAAPQAIPADEKPEVKTQGDRKRKADALDADDPAPGGVPPAAASTDEAAPAEKRKPGRPPGKASGNANGEKEGLGEKVVKKAKKILPTAGKTERKTRSQGPA